MTKHHNIFEDENDIRCVSVDGDENSLLVVRFIFHNNSWTEDVIPVEIINCKKSIFYLVNKVCMSNYLLIVF